MVIYDEQYPGPPIQNLLRHALKVNNVIDIEGQIVEFEEFRLIGVGDLWAGKADMRFYAAFTAGQTVGHLIAQSRHGSIWYPLYPAVL